MPKKLFVGNLSFTATEDSVKNLFSTFGEVTSVNIITDPMSGRPRGFCFVEMENAEEAVSALNDKEFEGRPLKVDLARERQERSGGGDRGGYRGGNSAGGGDRGGYRGGNSAGGGDRGGYRGGNSAGGSDRGGYRGGNSAGGGDRGGYRGNGGGGDRGGYRGGSGGGGGRSGGRGGSGGGGNRGGSRGGGGGGGRSSGRGDRGNSW